LPGWTARAAGMVWWAWEGDDSSRVDRVGQSRVLASMAPALLILAAGMGSRFGGLKQLEPVGPAGETMLDYAIFDAVRAGFRRAVFVIRGDFEAVFRDRIGSRYESRLTVAYVRQEIKELPPGFSTPAERQKPWGTGHAVWCARNSIRENFAVINADDFYGADAFARLARFLTGRGLEGPAPRFAIAGFRLRNTLSEHGAVSRGICTVGSDGMLTGIAERPGIVLDAVGTGREYSGDETVSMNCWGFTPAVFAGLDAGLRNFLAARETGSTNEFYLPAAVSEMIARGEASVCVLPTTGAWFGVTHRPDLPRVRAAIADLVRKGFYPAPL
jgi:NDP-sugar pyrophosphorylase family protein